MPRIPFVHFLDVFTDPPPSVWPATGETGCTKGAHLATKKKIASESGWHHTQTHGPVKVCEPGFGGNNDSVPLSGSLYICCDCCAHGPRPVTFHGYGALLEAYLQAGRSLNTIKIRNKQWMAGTLLWKPDRQSTWSSWKSIKIIRCWPLSLKCAPKRERGRGLARAYKQMVTLLGNIK